MLTSGNDISIVLSGGSSNINPNNSIGGDPSGSPVASGVVNNLFDDLSPEDAAAGSEEYRCVYIFNDGETSIWGLKIWLLDNDSSDSVIELGVQKSNEIQRITINGNPSGGSLTLLYNNRPFSFNFNPDLAVMSVNLQESLKNLTIRDDSEELIFKNIVVSAQNTGQSVRVFDVSWGEKDASRSFFKFSKLLDNNNNDIGNQLLPLGNVSVTLSTVISGSPINTIAPFIGKETTPPGLVQFFQAKSFSPIELPRLDPNDGFPLWIKRVTIAGAAAKDQESFSLQISALSLEPQTV